MKTSSFYNIKQGVCVCVCEGRGGLFGLGGRDLTPFIDIDREREREFQRESTCAEEVSCHADESKRLESSGETKTEREERERSERR